MSQRRRFTARSSMTLSTLCALTLLGAASMANAEAKQPPADYTQHCAACHGESGKGDGIMAEGMKKTPA
ncbi:MAG TPA: hypothetical protein PLK97_00890, partial [Pseudomonadales bacterium]|nr:hypothetical protein [Pseudomonadales bacterium]